MGHSVGVSGAGTGSRVPTHLMAGQHTRGLWNTESRRSGGEQARGLEQIAAERRFEKGGS